jgi:hypothetical protein
MVRDDLVALARDPPQITPTQLVLRERLNDQQPRRIREHLQPASKSRGPTNVQRATDRCGGIKIQAQQLTRLHRAQSNESWNDGLSADTETGQSR